MADYTKDYQWLLKKFGGVWDEKAYKKISLKNKHKYNWELARTDGELARRNVPKSPGRPKGTSREKLRSRDAYIEKLIAKDPYMSIEELAPLAGLNGPSMSRWMNRHGRSMQTIRRARAEKAYEMLLEGRAWSEIEAVTHTRKDTLKRNFKVYGL
ncbi:hypothetical protein L1O48_00630 [Ligilactobacillus equi]|uniref:hypothetical protein n=1 Tax=Ligilactobacillus equi TaxID=137357 RepID=UPI002ED38CED